MIFLVKRIFFFWLCLFVFSASLYAQAPDSAVVLPDTLVLSPVKDSVKSVVESRPAFKLKNQFLNETAQAVSFAVDVKKPGTDDAFFYLLAALVLLLACLKYFYNRYFTNLFKVFFNTSLRQSQLTDQLLQAKLPSLFFNFYFVVSGGLYIYILLLQYHLITDGDKWILIPSSILLLAVVYTVKYCTLKFTGWVTGFSEAVNSYIFVVFLINKIIGVFLVPFLIILTYSDTIITNVALTVSVMSVLIFLILRYIRSYGLIQNRIKISRVHFLLYIVGIELMPLLLIYKGLMFYLSKNL